MNENSSISSNRQCLSLIFIHEFIYNCFCYLGKTHQMSFQIVCNYIKKNICIKNLIDNTSIIWEAPNDYSS